MVLKIELDYMNGPIWKDTFDVEKGEMCSGIDIIDANEEINSLNDSIQEVYNSLYEFDVNEKAVVFNRKKAVLIKEKILTEIQKLISLIAEVNDGSFEIQDMVSGDICNW